MIVIIINKLENLFRIYRLIKNKIFLIVSAYFTNNFYTYAIF